MFLCVRSLRLALCVVVFFIQVSDVLSAQIHVPGMYATIQEGVDAAVNGDMVIVADGTYVENIRVNKSLIIRSENGAIQTFVQAQDSARHVFNISADQVVIEGFTISGALESDAAGIIINPGYEQCIVLNNQIGMPGLPNLHGIFLVDTHENYVEGNTISSNTGSGIHVIRSTGNTVKGNTISQNSSVGINSTMSVDNRFIENIIKYHDNSYGILLHVSNDNLVSQNEFMENYSDIRIRYSSSNNQIINNTCTNSSYHSISVDHDSIGNKISGNECTTDASFGSGIHLWAVGANAVFENTISGYGNGIGFQGATDCRVYSNYCNGNIFSGIDINFDSQRNQIYANHCNGNEKNGISVSNSSLNEVRFNTCSNNENAGFALTSSQENAFYRNTATDNGYGASIENSMNNRMFLNSFIDNDADIFSQGSETHWQDEEQTAYLFQGTAYTGFIGNFYSDHDLTDSDGNGVTDLPRDQPGIDRDDTYPLSMNHTFFMTASSDADFDGDIDGKDAAGFISAYVSESITADLNQDTVFDQLDIEAFAAVFGK